MVLKLYSGINVSWYIWSTFVVGITVGDDLKLDCGRGTVGIRGIGCFIIVGIVTAVGICGKTGEIAEGG